MLNRLAVPRSAGSPAVTAAAHERSSKRGCERRGQKNAKRISRHGIEPRTFSMLGWRHNQLDHPDNYDDVRRTQYFKSRVRLVAHGGCGRRQCGDWGRPAAETEGVLYYIIYIYIWIFHVTQMFMLSYSYYHYHYQYHKQRLCLWLWLISYKVKLYYNYIYIIFKYNNNNNNNKYKY